MPYVDVFGHPTWLTVEGSGDETILLLHGGLSHSEALLGTIGEPLRARWRVAAFDRRGHGRTADTPDEFHYESMVDETIAVVEHLGGAPINAVGWSDGGIVALLLALRRPDLVRRLVVIGSNYHWNVVRGEASEPREWGADDVPMDDPDIAAMAAAYAARSPDGAAHFRAVAAKGFRLFEREPELTADDLARITAAVLVMAGDRDLIPLDHTVSLFRALPNAQLAIVPGAGHTVPMERADDVAAMIARFLRLPSTP